MRPRPLFQSLPVFACFDRGLRFFVSKLCPNVRCLPSRAWIGQQFPIVVPGEEDPAAVADDGDGALDGFRIHIVPWLDTPVSFLCSNWCNM